MERRALLFAAASMLPIFSRARADNTGVTASEIKIGNIMPYSGPASAYGTIGHGLSAFWRMINDRGGVAGRRVNFITLDDGYVPAKTVEVARRLVEEDQVAFLLNPLGTAQNTAIERT